MCHCSLR